MADAEPIALARAWETALATEGFTLTDPEGEAEANRRADGIDYVVGLELDGGDPESTQSLTRLAQSLRDAPAILRAAQR